MCVGGDATQEGRTGQEEEILVEDKNDWKETKKSDEKEAKVKRKTE